MQQTNSAFSWCFGLGRGTTRPGAPPGRRRSLFLRFVQINDRGNNAIAAKGGGQDGNVNGCGRFTFNRIFLAAEAIGTAIAFPVSPPPVAPIPLASLPVRAVPELAPTGLAGLRAIEDFFFRLRFAFSGFHGDLVFTLFALFTLPVVARASAFLEAGPALRHDPEIMIRKLEIILGHHTVTGKLRVARQRLVFLKQLRGISPSAVVDAVAIVAPTILLALSTPAATTASLTIVKQGMSLCLLGKPVSVPNPVRPQPNAPHARHPPCQSRLVRNAASHWLGAEGRWPAGHTLSFFPSC